MWDERSRPPGGPAYGCAGDGPAQAAPSPFQGRSRRRSGTGRRATQRTSTSTSAAHASALEHQTRQSRIRTSERSIRPTAGVRRPRAAGAGRHRRGAGARGSRVLRQPAWAPEPRRSGAHRGRRRRRVDHRDQLGALEVQGLGGLRHAPPLDRRRYSQGSRGASCTRRTTLPSRMVTTGR